MRIDFKISMEHFHTSMNVSVDPFFRIISSGQSYNKVEANGGFLIVHTIYTLYGYHGADRTSSSWGRLELEKGKTVCLLLRFLLQPTARVYQRTLGKSTSQALCQTQHGCSDDGIMPPNVSTLLREKGYVDARWYSFPLQAMFSSSVDWSQRTSTLWAQCPLHDELALKTWAAKSGPHVTVSIIVTQPD